MEQHQWKRKGSTDELHNHLRCETTGHSGHKALPQTAAQLEAYAPLNTCGARYQSVVKTVGDKHHRRRYALQEGEKRIHYTVRATQGATGLMHANHLMHPNISGRHEHSLSTAFLAHLVDGGHESKPKSNLFGMRS